MQKVHSTLRLPSASSQEHKDSSISKGWSSSGPKWETVVIKACPFHSNYKRPLPSKRLENVYPKLYRYGTHLTLTRTRWVYHLMRKLLWPPPVQGQSPHLCISGLFLFLAASCSVPLFRYLVKRSCNVIPEDPKWCSVGIQRKTHYAPKGRPNIQLSCMSLQPQRCDSSSQIHITDALRGGRKNSWLRHNPVLVTGLPPCLPCLRMWIPGNPELTSLWITAPTPTGV